MNYSNGNSFANGNSMDLGSGNSYGTDGTRPPSAWFTCPGDPRWQI